MHGKRKTRPIIIISFWLLASLSLAVGPISVFKVDLAPAVVFTLNILFLIIALLFILALVLHKKIIKTSLILFSTVLIGVFILMGYWFNPYSNSQLYKQTAKFLPGETHITQKQALEDLDEMYGLLKRVHPIFLRNEPKETKSAYVQAQKQIEKLKTLSIYEFRRLNQLVLSTLNDAHTVAFQYVHDYHYLPDLEEMKQDGYSIKTINGKSLDTIFSEKSHLYSFEGENWGKENFYRDVTSLEGLSYLGFNPHNGVLVTYMKDNISISQVYYSYDFLSSSRYLAKYEDYLLNAPEKFIAFELDQGQDYALLTLNSCDYNDEYKTTLERMFAAVKQRKINNIIVDLRNNSGGNSQVANEFIKYLDVDKLNLGSFTRRWGPLKYTQNFNSVDNEKYENSLFRGNVFVLTSGNTFSSAMMFSQFIQDNDLGLIVGEVPGNAANGYGEITYYSLKNSGLNIQISTKEFKRADQSRDDYIIPDLAASSEEALNKVLDHIKQSKKMQ